MRQESDPVPCDPVTGSPDAESWEEIVVCPVNDGTDGVNTGTGLTLVSNCPAASAGTQVTGTDVWLLDPGIAGRPGGDSGQVSDCSVAGDDCHYFDSDCDYGIVVF